MKSNDLAFELKQLKQTVKQLGDEIKTLKQKQLDDEMWDSSDVIRHWKISPRTLASWRAEKKIRYVQVGNKIWYPQEARKAFLDQHEVPGETRKKEEPWN
ncbi:hypothetical protein [Prolixibacter denitrificans]|uniref:Helix-turn-helix protein n=1 Tax=Prolixibacter denitrificans TaxID=1541063 RepID=A0A2P8CHQ3_9BACT|nr:hypothetical protein [Prolixibacter denitrificans]PSK84511.1 hypothetical protein CLV93_102299 [Prolixibacter denitrificans]GET20684.1 hypothetical protein JCM18694_09300 [Prolixibacter denitrificans]